MFLEVLDPDAIPSQGTAIAEAIAKARNCFNPADTKNKVVVLITDGEDNYEEPLAEAKKAAAEGLIVYCLGIGSPGGVPIPINRSSGGIVYKKDSQGNTVLTSLNEETLVKIAEATGGAYFHSTGSGLELARIYGEISKLEKKELKNELFGRYLEQFMWPLGLAILLMLVEFFLPGRKKPVIQEGRFE